MSGEEGYREGKAADKGTAIKPAITQEPTEEL